MRKDLRPVLEGKYLPNDLLLTFASASTLLYSSWSLRKLTTQFSKAKCHSHFCCFCPEKRDKFISNEKQRLKNEQKNRLMKSTVDFNQERVKTKWCVCTTTQFV